MPKLGLIFRTSIHLKPIQVWFQVWRRIQKKLGPHPKCGTGALPEFAFLNTTAKPKGWNDESLELLWRYNLHYFDYLNRVDDSHLPFILRWVNENPRGSFPGWDPYPTSLRIVNWVKWLVRNAHADHLERARDSLKEQTAWLRSRLEYQLLANHLLANAKALVFAGKYLDQKDWYEKGLSIYRQQLPEQTCSDGINFERSPMYHAIIFEDMLDLAEYTDDPLFKDYAARMADGMRLLTGPDGKIAKFNDAAEGIAKQPAELLARAEKFSRVERVGGGRDSRVERAERVGGGGRGSRVERVEGGGGSGFLRMEAGEWALIAKCGEIGSSYQPGHAHADTWSFELWKSGKKLIGDTGCSTYVPGPIRSYERSTKAHNTVVVDGQNSSEVWASHRVGRRFDRKRHRREFELTDYGLNGVDHLDGKGEHDVEVRFHLPPGVAKSDIAIDCPGEVSWETCYFAEGWNLRKPGICAVFRQKLQFPCKIEWTIK